MIYNHKLREAIWYPSPNVGRPGGLTKPRFIITHYTANKGAEVHARWLRSKAARASAHLIIARDGTMIQLAAFDTPCWHAGPSEWNGVRSLNTCSLGVELDNPGWVVEDAGGQWRSLHLATCYPKDEVVIDERGRGWVTYTPAQLRMFEQVCLELIEAYPSIEDVLRHSEVALPAGRKVDPGFAWPAENMRSRLFGRADRL